tara:strand:- start:45016 stop:45411 length:396 start_codon:yes stop_codon:yes gene_type:complete
MPEDNKQVNDPNYVNVDKLIQGALGDKPFEVKGAFDNEMLDRVSQVIAGKKDAVHKDMFGDQSLKAEPAEELPDEEEVLDQDLTDDEIEDALNDEVPEEPEEAEEPEQEETPEEELEEPEEVENEEPNETT